VATFSAPDHWPRGTRLDSPEAGLVTVRANQKTGSQGVQKRTTGFFIWPNYDQGKLYELD
jgi:hypothetical protein